MKTLPKFKDIIGLYAEDEDNENSPFVPEYSEQQITDYCEKVLNLHLSSRPDGELMFEGMQIIRQLQEAVIQLYKYIPK